MRCIKRNFTKRYSSFLTRVTQIPYSNNLLHPMSSCSQLPKKTNRQSQQTRMAIWMCLALTSFQVFLVIFCISKMDSKVILISECLISSDTSLMIKSLAMWMSEQLVAEPCKILNCKSISQLIRSKMWFMAKESMEIRTILSFIIGVTYLIDIKNVSHCSTTLICWN